MTGVVIADDQALVRVGLRKILEAEPETRVVGEAADGEEAVAAAARLRPDVVLMDIRMPVLDGIEATRRIVAAQPATRVLMLTTFGLDGYVYDALRAGASGFMLKDAPPEEIAAAVRIVANVDALLAPAVTRSVIEEFARREPARAPAPPPAVDELTPREREVLGLLACKPACAAGCHEDATQRWLGSGYGRGDDCRGSSRRASPVHHDHGVRHHLAAGLSCERVLVCAKKGLQIYRFIRRSGPAAAEETGYSSGTPNAASAFAASAFVNRMCDFCLIDLLIGRSSASRSSRNPWDVGTAARTRVGTRFGNPSSSPPRVHVSSTSTTLMTLPVPAA
jgi:DNA-binding NarL/FixJ family response regulator